MEQTVIAPHGGSLILNLADEPERRELQEMARTLPQVELDGVHLSDVEMLACGAYSPLAGFMESQDYHSVIHDMHLRNGLPWSLPITLTVHEDEALDLKAGYKIALVDAQKTPYAVMELREIFPYDQELEASLVYGTTDEQHPGVRRLYQQGKILLGGPVRVFALPEQHFGQYRYTPTLARRIFAINGWRRVVGFQTRNPVHRAHEYIQKCALELVDGLFLHPLVGETKEDDLPAEVRLHSYEVLLEHYYPLDRVVLGVLPAAMRYAGPREAVFHALIRKNYGCSHFIVGRDHAGVSNYYGSYDAQNIFEQFDPTLLGITPLFFEHAFFCQICQGMASSKTCSHENSSHVTLSGTRLREMLQQGKVPPSEFIRPEVAKVLIEASKQPIS